MFDMREIGRRIASLRRKANITQMALADMMGISFQAVSNWERGTSMPDISKLGELSAIFNVSIDEMLGNTDGAKAVERILTDENANLSAQELVEVAPIMPPEAAVKAIKSGLSKERETTGEFGGRRFTMKEIIELAPYMDGDDIAEIVKDKLEGGATLKDIVALAPFMDGDDVAEIVKDRLEGGATLKDIVALAPFMDGDDIAEIVKDKLKDGGEVGDIRELIPFMDEGDIGEIIKNCYR